MEIELESKPFKESTKREAEVPLVHSHLKYSHPKQTENIKHKNKIYQKTTDIGNFKHIKGDRIRPPDLHFAILTMLMIVIPTLIYLVFM